jgi:hypothetical protein
MAIGDDAEIQAEARRQPAMVFTFHQKGPFFVRERSMAAEGKMSKARRRFGREQGGGGPAGMA